MDRAFLTGETADRRAETFHWAVASGIWGWFDDLMVPFAHGKWIAAHVPGATAALRQGQGHPSMVGRIGEGMRVLRAQPG